MRRGVSLSSAGQRAALACAVLCLSSGCALYNFHEVDPGKFYRSGQPTAEGLASAIDEFGIRTVVNLRGAQPEDPWYRAEKRVCESRGVTHHDLDMSARRIPHREDLRKLLDIYRDGERPILVHCQGGADRSGLASAIYTLEYMGWSKQQASRMLSPCYLHFAFAAPSKRYFLRIYEGRQWAYEVYDPTEQEYLYYDRGPAVPVSEKGQDDGQGLPDHRPQDADGP